MPPDDPRVPARSLVLVEKRFPQPVSPAGVAALQQALRRRLEHCRVRPLETLLAVDGRRLLWLLDADDTRVVRAALESSALWPAEVWRGRPRALTLDTPANVAVEHLEPDAPPLPGPVFEPLRGPCLATHRVIPTRTVSGADTGRTISFFHAPDAEAVRQAQRHASVPAGRVWAFVTVDSA